ncbi:hypothetical protein SNE25_21025 [Mucilaginibacter sabulilitoris]|uniref:Uncharacterized protein n=1 Tax=Mucilaginibacter sabulilitoris TaxID=1173583 RepID=A0ABZ0TJB8_9SPHI|nr:hypothetical protein [Mucilaginibacter sabulilitoris]WPU91804.1 hypothetical protein SNE25_21025 [Mucilaginibacter sabulilitoris]
MNIPPENVINATLHGAASLIRPVVFKEGDFYCCFFGDDPITGVIGFGDTPDEAINDWNINFKDHLSENGDEDSIVQHVKELIASAPPAKHVQEFYDQFRPVKRS